MFLRRGDILVPFFIADPESGVKNPLLIVTEAVEKLVENAMQFVGADLLISSRLG